MKEFDSLFTFYDKVNEFVTVCLLCAGTELFSKWQIIVIAVIPQIVSLLYFSSIILLIIVSLR